MASARLEKLLGPKGALAARLPGFTHRPQQVAFAKAVETALVEGRPCLAEAGTGTGKTFGYLTPLLQWLDRHGGRAVVSTHTLALQAQLVERDIPALLGALPELDIRAAALKGRGNFLCLQDLEIAANELWTQGDPLFRQIRRWGMESDTGDVAELDFTFPQWSEIAANADTCRQRECRFFDRCFYFKARKAAEECNLLVVNHALFFADLRLKRAAPNGPTLIPKYDAVIFDEAHHVDDTATRAFGLEWSSRRVPQLVARARRLRDGGHLDATLLSAVEALNQVVMDPFLSAETAEAFVDERLRADGERGEFLRHVEELGAALDALAKDLVATSEAANVPEMRDRAAGLARTATRVATELRLVTRPDGDQPDESGTTSFRWFHTRRTRTGQAISTLVRTPLAIDGALRGALFSSVPRAVFTSATLASGNAFTFLKKRLGLDGAGADAETEAPVEILEGSPFAFQENCLLYVPRRLGPPASDDYYIDRVAEEVLALVRAAQGRTFALFTAHRMLRAVRDRLAHATDYPLFTQGEMPNARLVDAFKEAGNGVLLGTSSFWEGVDVPGPALSLVILDKLPFATPDSPLQRAREKAVREAGGDAFRELSLPQAQIRLKQGFGRLLRTVDDRGVVAILDARLWTKSYGREFLADLPPCPRTDRFEDVTHFFAADALAAAGIS
jgi:Rad3-related DNA helicases